MLSLLDEFCVAKIGINSLKRSQDVMLLEDKRE